MTERETSAAKPLCVCNNFGLCDFHRYEQLQCKIGAIASRTQKSKLRAIYRRALLDIVQLLVDFAPRKAEEVTDAKPF